MIIWEREGVGMRKNLGRWMHIGACIGGGLVLVMVLACIAAMTGILLTDTAQAARTSYTMAEIFPRGMKVLGFTLSTAVVAEVISFALSWALAVCIGFLAPHSMREKLRRVVNGLSAVPAVVLGYMSLSYIAPLTQSPWLAVVFTLVMMSLMRQTLAIARVNSRYQPAVEAGDALGAYMYENVFQLVLPQAARGYLAVALRMLARFVSEGVAILMVLSNYSGSEDTLSSALMRALGVTGERASVQWILLLATLLLALVLLSNSLISATVQGGRNGKKNV